MAALIAAQREDHQVPCALACRALGVSRSWYYKWAAGELPPRAVRRQRLKAEVRRLFEAHGGKAGSPPITAGLREAGWRVSQNTVAALMAEQHLAARRPIPFPQPAVKSPAITERRRSAAAGAMPPTM